MDRGRRTTGDQKSSLEPSAKNPTAFELPKHNLVFLIINNEVNQVHIWILIKLDKSRKSIGLSNSFRFPTHVINFYTHSLSA